MKAGYRSDKWKWVLSVSQSASPAETTTAFGESDSAQGPLAVVADTGENGHQDDALHCEVNTSKDQQKNGTAHNHAKVPYVFLEDQLTKDQIVKTFGLDRFPKHLPCPYVNYSNMHTC